MPELFAWQPSRTREVGRTDAASLSLDCWSLEVISLFLPTTNSQIQVVPMGRTGRFWLLIAIHLALADARTIGQLGDLYYPVREFLCGSRRDSFYNAPGNCRYQSIPH